MGLGAFLGGNGSQRWTAALTRVSSALGRVHDEAPVAQDNPAGGMSAEGSAWTAPEIVFVRARSGGALGATLRVVEPGELAASLAPGARPIGGLVVDLTAPSRAIDQVLREIEESGVSAHLPVVALHAPGEGAAGPFAAGVPCPAGGEALATERAARICRALAGAEPEEAPGPASEAIGALRARLTASAAEATTREAMLVHDLRSPLGVVQGALAMLGEPGESHAPALLDLGVRAASELEQIVEALEALYACAGEPSRRDRVDVAALARGVVEGVRCAPGARGKTLRVSVDGDHWLVCDRQDLVRMLGNLLGNAVRHAAADVDVAIEGDDGEVRVRVRDDGPGIPPALLGRLFDRYVRDRGAGRMGLGLAIVRRLAERYGGSVAAHNRADHGDGRGACFVVRIPKRA